MGYILSLSMGFDVQNCERATVCSTFTLRTFEDPNPDDELRESIVDHLWKEVASTCNRTVLLPKDVEDCFVPILAV